MLARLRLLIALTAAAGAVAAVPAHAQVRPIPADVGPLAAAGGFVIQSCGETGSAAGWTETISNAHISTGLQCPPTTHIGGDPNGFWQQAGIWVSDRLATPNDATPGDRAEISFSPLVGTTITRIRWFRQVIKDTVNAWQPYTALGSSANIIDTCDYMSPDTFCGVGDSDWTPNDDNFARNSASYADLQNLSTTKVIAGLLCRPNPNNTCGNGNSVPNVQVNIASAFITIADTSAPTVGTPAGSGWTTTDWVQSTVPASLASNDLTGILATRVYADGSLIATLQRSCSYTRPRPCTDEPTGAVGIPTSGLADGDHSIQLAAVDAAGNETRVTRPALLKVDNQPPAAPQGLTSPEARTTSNGFSASWSLPPDSGTPIVTARYQLCQKGTCGAVANAPSLTSVSGLALPAQGDATLRVWLVDQLGHEDAAAAATLGLNYTPAPPPEPPSQPTPPVPTTTTPTTTTITPPPPPVVQSSPALKVTTLRRRGRKVTIVGTLSTKASGNVTIRYRVKLYGRSHTLTKKVTIARHAFRTTLRLSTTIARARTATVSVAYPGDSDTRSQTRTAAVRLH